MAACCSSRPTAATPAPIRWDALAKERIQKNRQTYFLLTRRGKIRGQRSKPRTRRGTILQERTSRMQNHRQRGNAMSPVKSKNQKMRCDPVHPENIMMRLVIASVARETRIIVASRLETSEGIRKWGRRRGGKRWWIDAEQDADAACLLFVLHRKRGSPSRGGGEADLGFFCCFCS